MPLSDKAARARYEHEKYLERNARVGRTCVDCGEPVMYSSTRCQACNNRRNVNRRKFRSDGWTKESVMTALRAWADVHGGEAPPASIVTRDSTPRCPSKNVVKRFYGSWMAGLQAAGLAPRQGSTRSLKVVGPRSRNRRMVSGGMWNTSGVFHVGKKAPISAESPNRRRRTRNPSDLDA